MRDEPLGASGVAVDRWGVPVPMAEVKLVTEADPEWVGDTDRFADTVTDEEFDAVAVMDTPLVYDDITLGEGLPRTEGE